MKHDGKEIMYAITKSLVKHSHELLSYPLANVVMRRYHVKKYESNVSPSAYWILNRIYVTHDRTDSYISHSFREIERGTRPRIC